MAIAARFAAAMAGALCLTAGAPSLAQDMVFNVHIDSSYSRLSVSRATEDGALVEIYGAPEDQIDAILDALRMPARFGDEEFIRIEHDPYDDRIDRIVIVFGPAPSGRDEICLGSYFDMGALTDDYWAPEGATAAFCDGFEAESIGTLRSDSLGDPTSEGFERAMALLLREIMPRRNPHMDRGNCRRLGGIGC